MNADEMKAAIGKESVSEWVEVTQEMINKFADATGDHQFIHIDPEGKVDEPDNPLVEADELAKLRARAST